MIYVRGERFRVKGSQIVVQQVCQIHGRCQGDSDRMEFLLRIIVFTSVAE